MFSGYDIAFDVPSFASGPLRNEPDVPQLVNSFPARCNSSSNASKPNEFVSLSQWFDTATLSTSNDMSYHRGEIDIRSYWPRSLFCMSLTFLSVLESKEFTTLRHM